MQLQSPRAVWFSKEYMKKCFKKLYMYSMLNNASIVCRGYLYYYQNLLRIFFRQSSFYIGSYSKFYLQNWKPKKSFFKVGSSESINKTLGKYLQKKLHFRKLFCIYEQNIWNTPVKEFFFQFIILLVIFVIALNALLLKCLISTSVNHHVVTSCFFT